MAANLVKRVTSALLMVLILAGCILHPISFMAMISFAIIVMVHEYYAMTVGNGCFIVQKTLAALSVLAAFLLHFFHLWLGIPANMILLSVIPIFLLAISMLFHAKELIEADKGTHLFFPIIYIGIPMALLPMLMFPSGGKYSFWYFIMLIVLIWLSDTGAYIFGMAFGQRPGSKKFCPVISPKKSWIGVIGGVVVTIATAILLKYLNITPLSLLHMLVIALLVCIFGISGDLFESLIKRHSGCKDSGNIMPGHGGLLDRFDSALFVIPVIVVYLQFNGLLV